MMNNISIQKIICIQKIIRGYNVRKRFLPLILYKIQFYLQSISFHFSKTNEDGRVNSSIDEDNVIHHLVHRFSHFIKKPPLRNWYDIAVYDYYYGWIPVNIKTTTTNTCDNSGNLAICVQAYTDYECQMDQKYDNGPMSQILVHKLKTKEYNKKLKKDYYFLVLNKNNPSEVIINSIKGLTEINPNINNLPFQIRWDKNKNFVHKPIQENINQFVYAIQKPNPSWKEYFLSHMRRL